MKLITSRDLPQADRIESVLLTVVAVNNGARTDIEIANNVPGIHGDDRQGRYYRNAAEILGFIINQSNNSKLTQKGIELLKNPVLENPLFIKSVLNLEVYQKLLPYLELHSNGCNRNEIISYLQSISDPNIGQTMIQRRISTILSWPKTLGFLKLTEDNLYILLNNLDSNLPFFEINDIDQPLLPFSGNLSEFETIEQKTSKAKDEIQYFVDQAKLERSNNSHIDLVNLVAKRIREKGGVPKSNQLIDLAVRFDNDYIFEMKSTTEDNVRSQIRRGISQLYEYRYLQNNPSAKLVLVIQNPLTNNHEWLLDYTENDRNINLVWDGNKKLYGTNNTKLALSFLNLQ